jgi:hypothetical protein
MRGRLRPANELVSRFAQGGRESFSDKGSSMWFVATRKRLPTPFALHATKANPTLVVFADPYGFQAGAGVRPIACSATSKSRVENAAQRSP